MFLQDNVLYSWQIIDSLVFVFFVERREEERE